MSQFGQKYYLHYHTPKKRERETEHVEFSFWSWSWSWSREYRLFEFVIIFLLLLILLCLCLAKGENKGQTIVTSYQKVIQTKILKREKSATRDDIYHLGEKYPRSILPSIEKLKPKQGSEVTLEEYMYYVNDTKEGYPDFIDAKTNRYLENKKPSCFQSNCPIQGLTKEKQKAYALWLGSLTQESYKVKNTPAGFLLVKRETS